MLKARTVGLGIVALAAGGVTAIGAVAHTGPLSHTREVTTALPTSFDGLDVRAANGRVRVIGGAVASVTRVEHWSLRRPHAEPRIAGGVATLTDGCTLHFFGCSVDYVVTVPEGTKVEVHDVNGRIELQGLTGDITAKTTNGSISAVLGEVTNLELRSTNGSITAVVPNGDYDLDLGTVNGHIATPLQDHDDAANKISAHTTNGSVTIVGK